MRVCVDVVCSTVKLVQVQEFRVQNATTDTVQARWASVRGATGYRLTWASPGTLCYVIVHGGVTETKPDLILWHSAIQCLCVSLCLSDDHIENINLGDTFNYYMIQGLRSGSEYTITINPIFGDTEGPITATKVKTCN